MHLFSTYGLEKGWIGNKWVNIRDNSVKWSALGQLEFYKLKSHVILELIFQDQCKVSQKRSISHYSHHHNKLKKIH